MSDLLPMRKKRKKPGSDYMLELAYVFIMNKMHGTVFNRNKPQFSTLLEAFRHYRDLQMHIPWPGY